MGKCKDFGDLLNWQEVVVGHHQKNSLFCGGANPSGDNKVIEFIRYHQQEMHKILVI